MSTPTDLSEFRVTLLRSGRTFTVRTDQTVLDAGLEAGLVFPHSCRSGVCKSCEARVIEGRVCELIGDPAAPVDAAHGAATLLCQARPLTDVVIDVEQLEIGCERPRRMPARVSKVRLPAADVAILDLALPPQSAMRFAAGQYVDILLPDGSRRSYSIASAPSAEGVSEIQLHVRHMPGGHFSERVFSRLRAKDVLRLEGPFGTFFLRGESRTPAILLASGTGIAPIQSIVEDAYRRGINRELHLYWGGRTRKDLYLSSLPDHWVARGQLLRYIPVLSEPEDGDSWTGRRGLVHRAVLEDFSNLSGFEVYACGAPLMVDAARRDFIAHHGLSAQAFFSDSFVSKASQGGSRLVD